MEACEVSRYFRGLLGYDSVYGFAVSRSINIFLGGT